MQPTALAWQDHEPGSSPSSPRPSHLSSVLSVRRASYGPNTALSYDQPLLLVRGQGSYLFDEQGNRYLDAVNNVAHAGHCHPKVTEAVCKQLATLNTNSRYLHPTLTTYTQELLATMPPSLETLYLCNSGSEANDLALRIALAACPGATHVAVMAGAYHGHLQTLIEMSPYKFWGRGGQGRPTHVHVLPCPDVYRGENLDGRRAAQAAVAAARRAGGNICAFFCESILSCGGQVVPPPGYLQDVYDVMHAAGAVCVADEVQCGFGRTGASFWGFGVSGVVPDIVTMGKSMGNGYPVSAVAVSKELASAFSSGGMEYFNTYGGATAACAAALATLRVVHEERYQERAVQVGSHMRALLTQLQPSFPFLGDVRGVGMMMGVEIIRCPRTKAHAPVLAKWIKERMKARRVLLSTDGPYDNVIKMKPPMVFGLPEAEHLAATLRSVLSEELTPAVRSRLDADEDAHARDVVLPRMEAYRHDAREMFSCLSAPAESAAASGALGRAGNGIEVAAAAGKCKCRGQQQLQSRL